MLTLYRLLTSDAHTHTHIHTHTPTYTGYDRLSEVVVVVQLGQQSA